MASVSPREPSSSRVPREQRFPVPPGPGAYNIRQDGHEASSGLRNEAKYSMGKAPRDDYLKEYLDPKIQEHSPRLTTKDCAFHCEPQFGGVGSEQKGDSQLRNSPRFHFGHAGRDVLEKTFLSKELQKKMPTTVTRNCEFLAPPDLTGRIAASTLANSVVVPIDRAGRFDYEKTYISRRHQPGLPARTTQNVGFMSKEGFGRQVESHRSTQPSLSFGTATRESQYLRRL